MEITAKEVIDLLIRPKVAKVTTTLANVVTGDAEHFLWTGEVARADGEFWIPTLFGAESVRKALLNVMKKKRSDRDEALESMSRFHTGLGDDENSLALLAYMEIDHLPQPEQEARYDALSAATGLNWCLKVHSGRKSVHAYLAFERPLAATDPLREEIQRLLVVVLEGDTMITNSSRLMRLPGGHDVHRRQPVLHLDARSVYDPVDIRDRLATYAASLGILDVDRAFRTLHLAERLCQQARHDEQAEVRDALLDQADLLRATRHDPDPRDVRIAHAMLPRKSTNASVGAVGDDGADRPDGVAARGRERLGRAVWLELPEPNPYAGLAAWTAVDAPCCTEKGGRKGTVMEGGKVWCHRHDQGFRPAGEREPEPVSDFALERLDELVADGEVVDLDAERADRERERAEADGRDADLAPLRERAARKRAEAAALDPAVVAGARAAMEVADDILGDVQRVLGVGSEKPACGVHVVMHSAASGVVRTFRPGCGRLRCRTCGPMNVASKIGAVLKMPVVNDAQAVGEPIGNRPVWVYSVESRRLKTFHSRWNRECRRFSVEESHQRNSDIHGDHAFAAFHLGTEVVVVSTFELPETGRTKSGRLVAALNDAEQIQRLVVWLGLSAYRVTDEPEVGVRVVLGKISSSHGLQLDPAGIARKATASPWIAVALHAKPGAVSRAMQARDVAVEEKVEDAEVKAVKSVGAVSLETVVEVARAAGGKVRVEPGKQVEVVQVEDADLIEVFFGAAS